MVTEVFVQPGDAVKKGDPLVALDTEVLEREKAKRVARLKTLTAESKRVVHILENKVTVPFDNFQIDQFALSEQDQVFWAEQEYLEAQLELLATSATGIRNQIAAQIEVAQRLEAELELAMSREARIEGLFQNGAAIRGDSENAKKEVLRLERELLDLDATRIAAEDRLAQNSAERRELLAARFRDATQRRAELAEATITVEQELGAINSQIARALVIAPVSGKVQSLPVAGAGDVILRSELIAELVPDNRPIQTEIEISADKIGGIQIGMEARIKVATFDFAWFGTVMGEVTSISPTSTENPSGEIVYAVIVTFQGADKDLSLGGRLLKPGMTITADLLGETKTVLSYILKPLRSLRDRAFTEA